MTGQSDDVLRRRVGDAGVVRAVFDEMPLLMGVYAGPDHTFIAANAALRTFVGRDAFIGVPLRQVVPELAGQQIIELLDEVYATGRTRVAREWRLQVDVGQTGVLQEIYVDFTASPRRAADGTVTGVLVHATEVTERVRERQATERQAAEAERRYRGAREVITALQEALLPTALPVLPGARIAASYLVAARDQAAGGDWFDAIPLPGGTVALVVGDVVGHGVAASAAMGQLRAVLSDALLTDADPLAALLRADAFAARTRSLRATTLALVVLDPATGHLRYCSCGQPPPLVVGADGSTRLLAESRTGPLGTGAARQWATDTLATGESVLLYSDGLVERPHRTLSHGLAELARVAADAAANRALPLGAGPTPAERICQLTVELLTRTGYDDDVTTLAAHRLPVPVEELRLEAVTTRASVRQLRHDLDVWLDHLDPSDTDRDGLALAIWEAIANAIDHAYPPDRPGPVRLEAALHADGVVECRITDEGTWRPPDTGPTYRGRGLLLAQRLVDSLLVHHAPLDTVGTGTQVTLRHRLHRPATLASGTHPEPVARSPRPPFAVEFDPDGGTPRMRVLGPLDILTAEDFARRLAAATRGGVLPLTVDLTAVTHLASAGVQVLHQLRDELSANGQQLALIAAPGSPARAVLDIVQLPHTGAPVP